MEIPVRPQARFTGMSMSRVTVLLTAAGHLAGRRPDVPCVSGSNTGSYLTSHVALCQTVLPSRGTRRHAFFGDY